MAERLHSHLEPDGTRAAWFEAADENLRGDTTNKASALYLAEDRAFFMSHKNIRYLNSEARKKVLNGM